MRAKLFCLAWTSWLAAVTANGPALAAADETRPKSDEATVPLAPFKVMAEWIQIRPVLEKRGRVQYVTITHVTPRSPAAAAGIKRGLILVSLQGVKFPGRTLAEFHHELSQMKAGDWLEVGVADAPERDLDGPKNLRIIRLPFKGTPPARALSPPPSR